MMRNKIERSSWGAIALLVLPLLAAVGCPAADDSTPKPTVSVPPPVSLPAPVDASEEHLTQAVAAAELGDALAQATELPAQTAEAPGEVKKSAFDPVKFFDGWEKPKLALVFSGRQDGYLEPCGCAGLENQKGGLNRRHALFEQLRERGWPLAALDVGGMVRRFGKQAEIQFAVAAEALKLMHYEAIGFGPHDLQLSTGEVAAAVAGAEPGQSIFVSADVSLFGLTPKFRVFEAGGFKIGVTSVLGETYRQQVNNAELEVAPLESALDEVLPELERCDLRVLLAHATFDESVALAKRYPTFDFVVAGDGGDEPPHEFERPKGVKPRIVEVGHKGMFAVVVGLYDDPAKPPRYQRVALDSRYPNTPEMQQIMSNYQQQLQALGWSGLGLRPVPHPRTQEKIPESGKFLGGASCKDCHTKAWEVWAESSHAHATDSLVHATPARQFDAECVSCHSTGWNPQEFFPYKSGYLSQEETPHLVGNSCENCHGPGGAHVAAEAGSDSARKKDQRLLMRVTLDDARNHVCQKCHDLDNSPEFSKPGAFDHYWSQIEHVGKD